MYTIGQFALVSRLSPRMLRFYDERGLLKPARVDPVSGYRWYDEKSLARAREIVIYKGCGLSLEEIGQLAAAGTEDGASFRAVLLSRRRELDRISRSVDINRAHLEKMLEDCNEPGPIHADEIGLSMQRGLSLPYDGSDEEGVPEALSELFSWGAAHGLSFLPPHCILRDLQENDRNEVGGKPESSHPVGDARVFLPLEGTQSVEAEKGIAYEVLPACRGLRFIHRGSLLTLGDTWRGVLSYLEEKWLSVCGPVRETLRLSGPSVDIEIPVEGVTR